MSNRYSVEAIITAVDDFSAPIAKMQGRLNRFTRGAASGLANLEGAADKALRGFRNVGAVAGAGAVAAGAAFSSIIQEGAEFERAIVSAGAKMGVYAGSFDFQAIQKAAEDFGASTEFNAQQAAGALDALGQAGFNAQQAMAALPGAGDLATVAVLDLTEASAIATDILGSFGLVTSDTTQLQSNMARVNDVLAKTSTSAAVSVVDLNEAIKQGGQGASAAGANIETFSTLVAAMGDAGIKGGRAGTGLNAMFRGLSSPSAKAAGHMRRLGLQVADSEGNMRDTIDIIGDLGAKLEGMGNVQKSAILTDMFGSEGFGAVNILLSKGADGLRDYRTTLENASGAAAEMAATMRDTTTGDIDNFTSAIDGVQIAIFGVVKGPLRQIVKSLTDWVSANQAVITSGIQEFLDFLTENLPTIVTWGMRIARVAGTFLAIAGAIKLASAAMTIFNAIAALNPIGLLVIAIVAAVAIIAAFWPEITAWLSDLWDSITEVTGRIVTAMGDFISRLWEPIKEFLMAYIEFVVGVFRVISDPIIRTLKPLFDMVMSAAGLIMAHWEPISAFFADVWDGIAGYFTSKWDEMIEGATLAYNLVMDVWEPIKSFFSGLFDFIVDYYAEKFGSIADGLGKMTDFFRGIGRETISEVTSGATVDAPSERVSRSLRENVNRQEVTIRAERGTEVTSAPRRNSNVSVQASGAF